MDNVFLTQDIVKSLVEGGLSKGVIETDFGRAVVRSALINAIPTFTITFPDVREKWAIVDDQIMRVKFNELDLEAGKGVAPVAPVASPPTPKTQVPMETPPPAKPKTMSLIPTVSPAKKKVVGDTHKAKEKEKSMATKKIAPKVARPRTAVAKEKAKTGKVPEQPPTKLAYVGRPVDPKAKGNKAKSGKVTVPLKTSMSKKTGKVTKVGPKEPVWRRQLNWNGTPEKIDINLYPNKIICSTCGQPRYLDPRNAGIESHPVTLCKPCSRRAKNTAHNARAHAKVVARRAEMAKAAKKTYQAIAKPPTEAVKKAPGRAQAAGKGKTRATTPSPGKTTPKTPRK